MALCPLYFPDVYTLKPPRFESDAYLCTDGQLKQCARAFSLRHRNLDFIRIAQLPWSEAPVRFRRRIRRASMS